MNPTHSLLYQQSSMTVMDLVNYFNGNYRHQPFETYPPLLVGLYHWGDDHCPILKLSHLREDASLHVFDNSEEGNLSHTPGRRLYRVDCIIRNPCVVERTGRLPHYPLLAHNEPRLLSLKTYGKRHDYDSIIQPEAYDERGRVVRQISLLKPHEQVLNLLYLGML